MALSDLNYEKKREKAIPPESNRARFRTRPEVYAFNNYNLDSEKADFISLVSMYMYKFQQENPGYEVQS